MGRIGVLKRIKPMKETKQENRTQMKVEGDIFMGMTLVSS